MYCAVTVQTAGTLTFWSPCIISSVKAEKGKLDNAVAILTCIGHSVTLNEDWAIKAAMLRGYAIKLRTQWINHQTASMNDFCNAQRAQLTQDFQANMAASHARFEQNMTAMDQQTEGINKVLTGVQNYTNPVTGRTMELPSNSRPVYFHTLSNAVQIGGDKPRDWTVLQPK